MRLSCSESPPNACRAVRAPVIVIDGLDEARGETFNLARSLIRPLAAYAVVIVSTRDLVESSGASLVAVLDPAIPPLDLADPQVQQRSWPAIRTYVEHRLRGVSSPMNAAVAQAR